ncbi:hypothetical protein ONZ51_g5811 [Trametes cubensis]|uniref:Helicase ATP-binding domain-containing protein n=1 Tax=Trametes cubensis TaxID=1111947 RepID=A0AAD7TVI5_9APHY|nr:hypothetical protein ONZ51_g5811 [Trametes cubensis]
MPVPTRSRLISHDEERARSYAVLQAARDAAARTRKYDSTRTRNELVTAFRERTQGKTPYGWQVDVAEALLLGLDYRQKVYFVISPLNALERDQASRFEALNISAAVVNRETFNKALLEDIRQGTYRIVLTSPEMTKNKELRELISSPTFGKRVGAFIVDEAHCIPQWSPDFRPEYGTLEDLRTFVPSHVPTLATSATMTPEALRFVRSKLCINQSRAFHLNLGNDRPNIKQEMRFMSSASDYSALDFVVENAKEPRDLPRTIVFVNTLNRCHAAVHRLRQRVPEALKACIGFYHAKRASASKVDTWAKFVDGRIRVLVATEAAGMFGVPDTLSIWLQRAGRAGRSPTVQARAVMLVQMSVVQKVGGKKGTDAGRADESDTDFEEEEEKVQGEPTEKTKVKYKKEVEEGLRTWIETKACRRAVADAYFDNPPRETSAHPHQCCDNCARRHTEMDDTPSGSHSNSSSAPKPRTDSSSTQHEPHTTSDPTNGTRDAAVSNTTDVALEEGDAENGDDNKENEDDCESEEMLAESISPASPGAPTASRPLSPKRRTGDHLKFVKSRLYAWRLATRRSKYRHSSLKADNILPEANLKTIASQRRALKTVEDLQSTLNPPWPLVHVHGEEVLRLVKQLDNEHEARRQAAVQRSREERRQATLQRQAEEAAAKQAQRQRAKLQKQWAQSLLSYHRPLQPSGALNAPSVQNIHDRGRGSLQGSSTHVSERSGYPATTPAAPSAHGYSSALTAPSAYGHSASSLIPFPTTSSPSSLSVLASAAHRSSSASIQSAEPQTPPATIPTMYPTYYYYVPGYYGPSCTCLA